MPVIFGDGPPDTPGQRVGTASSRQAPPPPAPATGAPSGAIPEEQVLFDSDGHDHDGENSAAIDHDSLENVTADQHHAEDHASRHYAAGDDPLTGDLDANARVGVRKNSTGSPTKRRTLNLIEGSNVTLTVADDSGGEEVDVTIAAASGGGDVAVEEGGSEVVAAAAAINFGAGFDVTDEGSSVAGVGLDLTEVNATWGEASLNPLGTNHDYAIGAGSFFRLGNASACILTGIAGGAAGRRIVIVNVSAVSTLTLNHEDTGSAAANRIVTQSGANLTLAANGGICELIYDATTQRWRQLS